MGGALDMRHMAVPACERGAEWWLVEHEAAEQAVTIAAAAQDVARDDGTRYLWRKMLDARLDHLERVEDVCDAIMRELRDSNPAWLADACEFVYLKGGTWASCRLPDGMKSNVAYGRARRVLRAMRIPST